MPFLLTHIWVWLIISLLPATPYHDLLMTTVTREFPKAVRFVSHALLDSYGVVIVDKKRSNRLRFQTQDIYRVHPQSLYRVHRPASAIVILLLGSGDIESNPAPVQYPCTVCEKYLKRNQCGIMCDGCSHWTHAHCDGVGEAEYLLLTTQQSSEWFCPLSLLSISSLSLWS